jgi:ribosomal protein S18 acetylase RimI-like enzyme
VTDGFPFLRIRAIEEALFKCRPSLETVNDGDWVWRFAKGYTGRANSLQSLNVEDINDAERRLAVHVQRSRDYGIVPKFRMTPLVGSTIIDLLDQQGWSAFGRTHVLCHESAGGVQTVSEPRSEFANVAVVAPGSARWRKAMAGLLGLDRATFETYRELLVKLPMTARGFLMHNGDGALASAALCAVADEVGAVFSLTTAPQYRRQGFARQLMFFMQEYLRKTGAKQIALQVEAKNRSAVALYKLLGYKKAFSYTYRTLEAANK